MSSGSNTPATGAPRHSLPVMLSIAGSDCSAGAGLQADLKAGFALGCYPLTAVTCVVSEVPGKVEGLCPLEPDFVAAQVRLCLREYPVRAIKTGMLYSPAIVAAVAAELRQQSAPLVIDPVMIATAGEPLMLREAISSYEQELIPLATLLTPNLDELSRLLGTPEPQSPDELADAALALARRYRCAILAKGGHLPGRQCCDILAEPDGSLHHWEHPRCEAVTTHGTGCTLSAAVAAGLAAGAPLRDAVERALIYTGRAIAQSWQLGLHDALNHRPEL